MTNPTLQNDPIFQKQVNDASIIIENISLIDYTFRKPCDTTWPDTMRNALNILRTTGNTQPMRRAIDGMPSTGKTGVKSYWYETLPQLLDEIDTNIKQTMPDLRETLPENFQANIQQLIQNNINNKNRDYAAGYKQAAMDILKLLKK